MNIFFQRRLRDKFIVAFVLLSLTVIISMGGAIVFLVSRVQKDAVFEMERQLVKLKIREIESFIQEIRGLSIYKIEPYYDSIEKISDESREFLARGVIEENPSVEDVTILGLEGNQLFRVARGRNKPFTIPELSDKSLIPSYTEEGLEEFKEKRDYMSPVYYNDSGIPKVTLIRPIINEKEDDVGILRIVVDLSEPRDIIARDRLGSKEKGYILALGADGDVIAHSYKEREITKADILGHGTKEAIDYFSRQRGIPDAEFIRDEYKNAFGNTVMALARVSQTFNWTIIAEWPKDDAMSVVNKIILGTIAFSFLAFIAIVILTILLVNRVTHPLKILTDGAKIIGKGNFNHRIKVNTRDEIEELGSAFNQMARDLKEVERLREVEIRAKALKETLVREKQLSKLKDAFIAVASHQFRTPLSVIRWSIDVIRMQKNRVPITKIEEQIKDIFSNTMKLVIIADDLLTVAEFGLGKYKPKNIVEFDIVSATKDIIKIYSKLINKKKITLEFKKPKESLLIKVNKRAIHAAIKNLIDNAITYTREGGRVFVNIEKLEKELKFSAEDNGIGIPRKDKRFVFTQFFRASNAVEAKNVGTGLGLYIIKNIIDGHGGRIGLRSEQNKGSTFWFTLPL